uniref:Alkaline phosphatase, tissue-nonspecific isozyme n=1 Tax=Branchiostoma floridae TaxID=7739 RepID=C3XQ68_BRAFL|eukprot:XP_002614080.1 hypothetical protein BRAFLDRAFT_118432 [Branchiostoma floridae]
MFGAPVKFVLSVAVWLSSWTLNCSAQTEEEKQPEYWNNLAWQDIQNVLQLQPRTGVAKNLVLFLGDGMGVSTVTAGRILKGQLAGRTGEEELLEMDKLPYSALVKTYNVDRQTGDSAGTATAYLSGVKANYATVGVDATVAHGDCAASLTAKTTSILEHAHAAGKSVGIVATARVTHATPAGTYAYAANRAWEHDGKMPSEAKALGCTDIAQQLVEDNPFIKVILGGGRGYFTSTDQTDPEYPDQTGFRTDGRDLIQEWQDGKQGAAARYVWRKAEFDQVDPAETDFLMGKFDISADSHALNDLVAFNDAIAVGKNMLDLDETLITVTADHSHMFGFGGYAPRGTPILGIVPKSDDNIVLDGMPFTNILYGNGPGGSLGGRQNLTGVDTADKNYRQQAAVPMKYESHGGEDVSVFADGPMAHLFRGLHEQVYVAHVMKYAACLGEYTRETMFGAPVKFVLVAAWWSAWVLICSAQTEEERQPDYWNDLAWQDIQDVLQLQPRTGVAKNLVLFLGDGMGVSTVTAGRILKGQLAGRTGEEELLEMDKLPYSALVKTYNLDRQTGDSAATATAYLGGVKANYETLGVDGTVAYDDCAASLTGKVTSVLEHAHAAGKSTGIVVTSRITHATPAASYAYAANRAWEHDGKVPTDAQALGCKDIALQLVQDNPFINVILGGGRAYLTTTNQSDPEYPDQTGFRTDGRDLIQEWQDGKQGAAARYVWRKAEFD